jgi:hypothetical protein
MEIFIIYIGKSIQVKSMVFDLVIDLVSTAWHVVGQILSLLFSTVRLLHRTHTLCSIRVVQDIILIILINTIFQVIS